MQSSGKHFFFAIYRPIKIMKSADKNWTPFQKIKNMWELKVGSPDKQQKLEICSMNGMIVLRLLSDPMLKNGWI